MEEGDIPVFMVYDTSENEFYDAQVLDDNGNYNFISSDYSWFNFNDQFDLLLYMCFVNTNFKLNLRIMKIINDLFKYKIDSIIEIKFIKI